MMTSDGRPVTISSRSIEQVKSTHNICYGNFSDDGCPSVEVKVDEANGKKCYCPRGYHSASSRELEFLVTMNKLKLTPKQVISWRTEEPEELVPIDWDQINQKKNPKKKSSTRAFKQSQNV